MITNNAAEKKSAALKLPVDQVDDTVYLKGFSLGAKLSLISIFALFLGFFLHFPLKQVITNRITMALAQNRACPLSFQNLEFEWFLPKVKISSLDIPSLCLGGAVPNGKNLALKNLSINILGPSFSPFGLKLSHSFMFEGMNIKAMHALTPGGHVFRLEPTKLNIEKFHDILGNRALAGMVALEGLFDVDSNFTPREVKFSLDSKDFRVQSIALSGFQLPALPIGLLSLKLNLNARQKIVVDELLVGDDKSPIRGNFTGSVDLNKINPSFSTYDLAGTISFSDSFKTRDEFAMINLFLKLDQQKTYDGGHKVNIRGKLNAPPSISFD